MTGEVDNMTSLIWIQSPVWPSILIKLFHPVKSECIVIQVYHIAGFIMNLLYSVHLEARLLRLGDSDVAENLVNTY